jgi:multicomponent Na+:H+ antiporter subunit D
VARVDAGVRGAVLGVVRSVLRSAARHHGGGGLLARTWPTGSMLLWVAVLLGASLILYL